MTTFSVTVKGLDQVRKLGRSSRPALVRGLMHGGQILAGEIRRQLASSFARTPGGRRTGALSRDFRPVLIGGGDPKVKLSSTLPYANIQEVGGTIRPVRAKYLAIPLTLTARRVKPRAFPGKLFPIKGKRGLLLATQQGKKVKPQYALRKSVTLRAKRYVEKALQTALPSVLSAVANEIERFFTTRRR